VSSQKRKSIKMAAAKKATAKTLHIPKQRIEKITIYVGGDNLCVHRFGFKARQEILDKQLGKARRKKEVRNPHAEYIASKYVDTTNFWDGVPCAAFRRGIIDAASFVEGVTKVHLRGAVFIDPEGRDADDLNIIPIRASSEVMRQDVVRLPNNSADLRFRAYYVNWAVKLNIRLDPDIITPEQLHHLVERSGFSIGLCEARPQKSGEWGQYGIVTQEHYEGLPTCRTSPDDLEATKRALETDFGYEEVKPGDDNDEVAA
jgi:hypothetical protein